MFDLKFPRSLKNGHIFDAAGNLYLATLNSTGGNSAQTRRIWVAGIHKLANAVSLSPCNHKPRTLSSLWCVIAVYGASEHELKVICVIGNSTIFLLVASFIMDAGYKLKVIPYAEEHGNRAPKRHFGPPPTEKKPFAIGRLVKNIWKNEDFQRF